MSNASVAQVLDRVRLASASSLLVRSLLIGALGISVTVGGVLVGALVVSPVVSQVSSRSAPMAAFSKRAVATVESARRMARERLLTDLPVPVRQYAAPALLAVSLLSGLTALLVRRQSTSRSVAAAEGALVGAVALTPRAKNRLTPRSVPRIGGKHQRTPRAVEAMAASGASASDIAWKTGLPFDAVQLLLAISTGPRQLQPPTA